MEFINDNHRKGFWAAFFEKLTEEEAQAFKKEYYAINKEKRYEYQVEYLKRKRAEDPHFSRKMYRRYTEAYIKAQKKHYQKNKEKILKKEKEFRLNNRERYLATQKRHRDKDVEAYNAKKRALYKLADPEHLKKLRKERRVRLLLRNPNYDKEQALKKKLKKQCEK